MKCFAHLFLASHAVAFVYQSQSPHIRSSSVRMSALSDSIQEKYQSNVMSTYGRYPITIKEGKGCKLVSVEGKEYLDFVAGISTCALGHADDRLIEAITKQMQKVHHVSNLYYIPEQADLAELLVKNSCADRAFFCNSGAEANEAAIKLCRKYAATEKGVKSPVIITALDSFHGRTLAAITATGQPKYQQNFGPLPPGFEYATYNDAEGLRSLVKKINEDGASEGRKVAGIMMEALQGEGGIRPSTVEFMKAAREICDETGALLMMDEVQVGVGRTGKMWGYENLGVEPDVFTCAKALGGGVPIGAMLCKDFCNVFQPGDHASTFGGNPLACAAALATVNAVIEDGLVKNAEARGEQLRAGLRALQKEDPGLIKDVRGWGLINGVELMDEVEVTAAQAVKVAMDEGLLLVPAGLKVVRFVPPLVVTEAEVDQALATFTKALKSLR
uniref:acetylornithine transaminase n=1 Tax=Fibrocapsa japonica TaxID=94617 RepID=A0A6U1PT46_9STRA|mmetsp:Transcript_6012/g.9095  ORF Transcript_6012/g.9095 Transcript_6012/m.9095 type:complete len:445 (+) Transcript_6012:97-1431(+)|eukprot:CAMPEP_0113934442 /NCGR_PEP_ID=MMETSP1339-20121228/1765_1 /TAXON_ID=94617 /ORGANISM="Fibrocapsa japonica" /LENGTH=444 /DNA_ID=CAMNT_0000936247 /DNA_START=88 /DNA_END=1422 /DNA_ORIENTATION=- /assembly_acc=CAM_ASM_000762